MASTQGTGVPTQDRSAEPSSGDAEKNPLKQIPHVTERLGSWLSDVLATGGRQLIALSPSARSAISGLVGLVELTSNGSRTSPISAFWSSRLVSVDPRSSDSAEMVDPDVKDADLGANVPGFLGSRRASLPRERSGAWIVVPPADFQTRTRASPPWVGIPLVMGRN